jgi:hypothetical protein
MDFRDISKLNDYKTGKLHADKVALVEGPRVRKPFQCDIRNKDYGLKNELTRHLKCKTHLRKVEDAARRAPSSQRS